jgi:hypothetical protein
VRGHPLGLVHDRRGANEQVAAGRQHDHEGPQGAASPRLGVEPHPQPPVVHLALLPRWGVVLQQGHPFGLGLVGQGDGHIAAQGRLAGAEPVFVAQALVDGGQVVGGQAFLDGLVVGGALGEGGGAQLGDNQLGEPRPRVGGPLLGRDRRPAGDEARLLGRAHVLAHGLGVHPERVGDGELGPARVPVLEDLHDVDHNERPPYHLGSFRPGTAGAWVARRPGRGISARPARVGNSLTALLGNSLTGPVGNYLTELRPRWGIL